jgi:hypothetical protein
VSEKRNISYLAENNGLQHPFTINHRNDEEMSTVTSSLNAVKADKWCEGRVPVSYNAQMMNA